MTATARLSHHLDLYRYWDAKRGSRRMPTRRDIDPTEIPRLLPHIALVDTQHGSYRWRLMGSHIADDFGCDLTGQPFGENVVPAGFVSAMTATFDRVLDDGGPVFEESVYTTASERTHAVSRLLLPLAASGGTPMILLARITRRRPLERASNYLKGASGQVAASFSVASLEDLEKQVDAWEHRSHPAPIARIAVQPILHIANIWGGGLPQIVRCSSSGRASLMAPLLPPS
jgi:hypothetical protein